CVREVGYSNYDFW
nr:immunoglobulin heavy chain junction region [Macaca mulatta]